MTYAYRKATYDDLVCIWDMNISDNQGDARWLAWKNEFISYNQNGKAATFIILYDNKPVGEGTLIFSPECGVIGGKSALADNKNTANINALRIRKEHEGKGHISALVRMMERYAAANGYAHLTIGVEAQEARNLAIYLHWGYDKLIASETEEGVLFLYYAKDLKAYQVAAYYFPDYHPDVRNAAWHGRDWTEWELVKRAEPRFPGHQQPKVPLWGYEDESIPSVMARKIGAAADHGLDAFIFDWYWYEDGPYLQRCLEEGFLQADNNSRLKFAIMWANHDLIDIHPAIRSRPYHVLKSGAVSEQAFIAATDHMISRYFCHPSYWRVQGGLYFSVYELMRLVRGLGGIESARRVFDDFRRRVETAGLGRLHLNAVVWGIQILPGEDQIGDPNDLLARLGFDSATSYVWIHHQPLADFPATEYAGYRDCNIQDFERFSRTFVLPYFPNVTMGWDSSPRTIQSDAFESLGYPYMATLSGNSPEAFANALLQAKAFLDRIPADTRILTINAWNEWTEGSYLEPDRINGMRYLEAIKRIFRA